VPLPGRAVPPQAQATAGPCLLVLVTDLKRQGQRNGVPGAGVIAGFTVDSSGVQHGFIERGGRFTAVNDSHAGTRPGGKPMAPGSPPGAIAY